MNKSEFKHCLHLDSEVMGSTHRLGFLEAGVALTDRRICVASHRALQRKEEEKQTNTMSAILLFIPLLSE